MASPCGPGCLVARQLCDCWPSHWVAWSSKTDALTNTMGTGSPSITSPQKSPNVTSASSTGQGSVSPPDPKGGAMHPPSDGSKASAWKIMGDGKIRSAAIFGKYGLPQPAPPVQFKSSNSSHSSFLPPSHLPPVQGAGGRGGPQGESEMLKLTVWE